MIDVRSIDAVDAYRDLNRVGRLTRTKHGSVFEYDEAFLGS